MRTKTILMTAMIVTIACTILMAKDFWERPYKEWKKSEAFKMKDNSPWAKSQTVASTISRRGEATDRLGDAGRSDIYSTATIRLFSALPIRQAYVRIMQLMNNYDAKSEAEKEALDTKLAAVLKRDFSKMIVVEFEFAGNDPESLRNVKNYLLQAKAEHLKQSCYLISDRIGRVTLQEYYPPSADGSGAKFVFPRMVDDKPVLTPEDKELTFDYYFEPVDQKVFIRFKVKELMYGGELAF